MPGEDGFDPAVVEPVVDFLAGLAGGGRALELGDRNGADRAPARRSGRAGAASVVSA